MKKVLILAATTIALGLSASAWAADTCGATPVAPTIPDAATAKNEEVNKVSKLIEVYATDIDKWQTCMNKMVNSEVEKSNAIIDNYTKLVAAVKERNSKK
jgi:hypothetical protein